MLKWVFGADTSPFRRSLNEMRGDVKQFTASAKTQLASMFGVGAITAWVSATLDAAGRINDLSKRLDMSAESFQRIAYASKLSSGDMETVGKSLTILTKNLETAKDSGDEFANAAAALNVNLAELAEMSPEGQLIELARGYEAATDKGAALTGILKLLGKSGGEIVPLLADGPEALAAMFGEATVATNEQIAAMDKLGDTIDSLKNKSVAWLGSVIDGVKIWGAGIEWALNKLTGGDADKQFEKRMDSIMYGDGKSKPKVDADAAEETAKQRIAAEKERAKLTEDIAKLEEEARIRALSLTEKILDAEKRRAELAAEGLFGEDETKALESRKQQLEVEKEIAGYRDEQAKNDKDIEDKRKKSAEEIKSLTEKGAEIDRANELAGMSDKDKVKSLQEERSKILADADSANSSGDAKKALELFNKAKSMTGEIDDLKRGIADKAQSDLSALQKTGPTIATSSLADIGGGGGARLMNNDQSRRMVDLLAIIAANTAGGSEGSKPPEPI